MCDSNVILLIVVWNDMFGAEIDLCLNLCINCTDPWQHGIYLFYMIEKSQIIACLQSRSNFGEQVLSILLTKITAAILDCNGSRRLER